MALSIIGTPAAAMAATITLPTHAAADIIIIFAYENSGSTPPTKPSAAGTVPTWVDIDTNTGSSTSARTAYAVATASNHTSGTWTNGDGLAVIVIRGQAGAPIGGHAEAGAPSTGEVIAPAITMTETDGTSILLHFYAHDQVVSWEPAPSGYTKQASAVSGGFVGVCLDTKNVTTTDGAVTRNDPLNGTYRGATVEILESPPAPRAGPLLVTSAVVRAAYF